MHFLPRCIFFTTVDFGPHAVVALLWFFPHHGSCPAGPDPPCNEHGEFMCHIYHCGCCYVATICVIPTGKLVTDANSEKLENQDGQTLVQSWWFKKK